MAYIKKLEDTQPHDAQQIAASPKDVMVQGQAGGNVPQAAPAGKVAGSSSSGMRFADLQRYVEANKPQSQALATQVSSGIEQKAQQDIGQVQTQALDSFREEVRKNQPSREQFKTARQAIQSPQTQRVTPEQLKQLRSFQYSGPAELDAEKIGQLQEAVKQAQGRADLTKTPEGRRTLIRDIVGNERYTAGMGAFDQMLLQVDPTARERLQQAAEGISQKFGNAADVALGKSRAMAGAEQGRIEREKGRIEDLITAETGRARQGLITSEKSREQAAVEQTKRINQFLDNADPSVLQEGDLEALGLDQTALQNLMARIEGVRSFGLQPELSKYGSTQSGYAIGKNITAGSSGTPEERARILALEKLIGAKDSMLTPTKSYTPAYLDKQRLINELGYKISNAADEQAVKQMYEQGLLDLESAVALNERLGAMQKVKPQSYYEDLAIKLGRSGGGFGGRNAEGQFGESEMELVNMANRIRQRAESGFEAQRMPDLSAEELYMLDAGIIKPEQFDLLNRKVDRYQDDDWRYYTGNYYKLRDPSGDGGDTRIISNYRALPSAKDWTEMEQQVQALNEYNAALEQRNQQRQELLERYGLEARTLDPITMDQMGNQKVINIMDYLNKLSGQRKQEAVPTIAPSLPEFMRK